MSRRLEVLSVAAVVAAASADSSIVALALPQLYGRFHTTVVGVSWVLTTYNAVVAATAVTLLAFGVSLRGRRPYAFGVALFLVASAACAFAGGLTFLIAARCVQGFGAAFVLASSIGVLRTLGGSRQRAIGVWTLAAGVGVAAGPALGGVLTQVFDWRAIFLLQVPVAALGLFALRAHPVADPRDEPHTATRGAILADLGIGLLFGALVGALFLSVLLLIPGWGYSPIRGAAIVSVLPVASVLIARLGRKLTEAVATVAGAALLALGLVALALLPRLGAVLPLCALALCGAGLGLALPVLSRTALAGTDLTREHAAHGRRPPPGAGGLARPRRAAPLGWLAGSRRPRQAGGRQDRPRRTGGADDQDRRRARSRSRLRPGARRRPAEPAPTLRRARGGERPVARADARQAGRHGRPDRGGRVPVGVRRLCRVRRRRRGRCLPRREEAHVNRALVALFAAALVLIAVELVLAARTSPVRIASPCAARPLFPGHGVDAGTQRVVLDGLGRAACSLGVSREALVLSFAGSGDGLGRPKQQVEDAVRSGLENALTDATNRGEIPHLLAAILRAAIEHAPIDQLISGSLL